MNQEEKDEDSLVTEDSKSSGEVADSCNDDKGSHGDNSNDSSNSETINHTSTIELGKEYVALAMMTRTSVLMARALPMSILIMFENIMSVLSSKRHQLLLQQHLLPLSKSKILSKCWQRSVLVSYHHISK
jgi:hypothetical protein